MRRDSASRDLGRFFSVLSNLDVLRGLIFGGVVLGLIGEVVRWLASADAWSFPLLTGGLLLIALGVSGIVLRWLVLVLWGEVSMDLSYSGEGSACFQPIMADYPNKPGNFLQAEQHRVAVRSTWSRTLFNVQVWLIDFRPIGQYKPQADFLPVPMHLMHRTEQESTNGVDVHPGREAAVYASLVSLIYADANGNPLPKEEILVSYAFDNYPNGISRTDTFIFTLAARARDARECVRYFRVWVDGTGKLKVVGAFRSKDEAVKYQAGR